MTNLGCQLDIPGKRNSAKKLQWKNCSDKPGLWAYLWAFSPLLIMGRAPSTVGSVTQAGGPGLYKKTD